MVIGSGLAGQFGMAAETTYGTMVTPTRFLEFNSESLKADFTQLESKGIGSGRFLRPGRHKTYIKGASGSVEFDLMTKGFGLPLKMALGANTVAQQAASSEYLHTIQPDALGLQGLFFTAQVGRPDVSGTSRPFNYEGCKVLDWELRGGVDEYVRLVLNLDAETEQTSTALAVASYASGAIPFDFAQGSWTLNGAPISIRSFSIKGVSAMQTDRRSIGNGKREPLPNGEYTVTGELGFEFESLARHTALVAGTDQADLVGTYNTGVAIPSGVGNFRFVVSTKALFYSDGQPAIGGPDVLMESLQFKALDDGVNPVVKIEYYTTDTAA